MGATAFNISSVERGFVSELVLMTIPSLVALTSRRVRLRRRSHLKDSVLQISLLFFFFICVLKYKKVEKLQTCQTHLAFEEAAWCDTFNRPYMDFYQAMWIWKAAVLPGESFIIETEIPLSLGHCPMLHWQCTNNIHTGQHMFTLHSRAESWSPIIGGHRRRRASGKSSSVGNHWSYQKKYILKGPLTHSLTALYGCVCA